MTVNTSIFPPVNTDHGLEIGLSISKIDLLIERLHRLKNNPEGHFHLTSDTPEQAFGVVDLMFYVEDD